MTSEVEICNLALSEIRAGSINSLDEASLAAQQCKLKYAFARDMLLRDAPWQFAHKLVALAETTDELFNWARVYQYPSDCLQINRLVLNIREVESGGELVASRLRVQGFPIPDLNDQVKYELFNIDDNRVIAANEKELRADYRARISDPNLFDSQFTQALVYLLSSQLAIPIAGGDVGRQLRSDNLAIYQQYLEAALASDLNEQHTPVSDSDFITVRN